MRGSTAQVIHRSHHTGVLRKNDLKLLLELDKSLGEIIFVAISDQPSRDQRA
ncbi:MAG: hypothetical protein ACD_78C00224G0001, partial [uncultured bacterium (gcode 4)]